MATTKTTTPTRARAAATKHTPGTTARAPAAPKSTTATARATATKAGKKISAAAESFIETVKSRPLTSAAIAAGAAGAGALLWAKRGQIAEQAEALGEKASELGGKLGEQASAIGGRISDQASTLGGKISDQASAISEKAGAISDKVKARFAAEDAPANPATNSLDSTATKQSKVGAVTY